MLGGAAVGVFGSHAGDHQIHPGHTAGGLGSGLGVVVARGCVERIGPEGVFVGPIVPGGVGGQLHHVGVAA
jgi:hypothetical protein